MNAMRDPLTKLLLISLGATTFLALGGIAVALTCSVSYTSYGCKTSVTNPCPGNASCAPMSQYQCGDGANCAGGVCTCPNNNTINAVAFDLSQTGAFYKCAQTSKNQFDKCAESPQSCATVVFYSSTPCSTLTNCMGQYTSTCQACGAAGNYNTCPGG